jgi:hypothetical protein
MPSTNQHSQSDSPEAALALASRRLQADLRKVVGPMADAGPVLAAKKWGVDKVLASRLLKALRTEEPLAFLHRLPGNEPLMRVVRKSAKLGAPAEQIEAIESRLSDLDSLVRDIAGDRSALETLLSGWVPDMRREFELRRKQSLFRAMSQLKGAEATTQLAAVLLHPSATPGFIDIVWVSGFLGLRRLKFGANVRFATRRVISDNATRHPTALSGDSASDLTQMLLPEFCSRPVPSLHVRTTGNVVHYTLADNGVGPRSAVDLVACEVNRAELPRVLPKDTTRKSFVYAEVSTPAEALLFDVVIHQSLFTKAAPELRLYDTSFEGVANPNDPQRDADRLDLADSLESLGVGLAKSRSTAVPIMHPLLSRVCQSLSWKGDEMRIYRTLTDYPVYGSQVTVILEPDRE